MAAALVVSGAVLLIACVNLAHMFLARCLNRQRETGIRLALGCSSLRIIRQFLTEGCLLSLLGGAASLSVASWSARILAHFFEQMTGGEGTVPIHLDWRSAGWTGILCLFSVLLFSLVPAWRLSRVCPSSAMKDPTGWFPRGRSTWVLFLVGTQVALAFVLVACANLFVRSAWNAARGNPGFALERGLIVEMDLAFSIRDERRAREVYQAALDRLRLMPGVEAVSLAWTVPYDNTETSGSYQRSAPSTGASPQASPSRASVNIVTSDYFRTLGVSLLQGREFTRQEEQKGDGPRVAIIDELLARRLWPSENPIGLFMQSDGDAADAIQIVGIVPSLRETIMEPQAEPHVYLPFGQHYRSDMYLHIRTQQHVPDALQTSLIQKVREELQALDPTLPVLSVRTWDEHVRHSMEFWAMRMGAGLFAILGILALGLAAVGLFSVKSYWVAQRTREIGVRMALGATERMIVGQVLREALGAALIGLSLGLLLIWISARFLNSLLLDARGTDPMVLLATLTVLLTVLLLASLLPARRAARIHPMEALKQE